MREPTRIEVTAMADHAKDLTAKGMRPDEAVREALTVWERELDKGSYTLRTPLKVSMFEMAGYRRQRGAKS